MATEGHILITGGAGFIGSHVADELLRRGHRVRVLDSLVGQVHGEGASRPAYLDPEIELLRGDVRDAHAVERALAGVTAVYHFAATVGVGQSMYELAHYTAVNDLGTAVLLEALVKSRGRRRVERLVVASSMSVYGEGLYQAPDGSRVSGVQRSLEQLRLRDWEPRGPRGEPLRPVPTSEDKPEALHSIYALNKFDQERMCLLVGQAYGVPTVALRFFNVYGTRQALSNPYTGVLAIFAARYLNGNSPLVFEDGRQRRDFVAVEDVARACALALTAERAAGTVINVGSGEACSVLEVATKLAAVLGKRELEPELTGKYRVGDIRHCFADIARARELLGYEPRVRLEDGLGRLAEWLAGQVAHDKVGEARRELAERGLTV
jgi:dTDP-L-rhamnose 4-epimerase